MLVNISQNFDFNGRRYLTGENPDVDPQIGSRWIAEGKATLDTDGVQNGPSGATSFSALSDKTSVDIPATNTPTANALAGKLSPSDIVNDLTTGGTNKALSAQQAVVMKAILDSTMLQGTGAPSNSIGVDGQLYSRKDAPFDGVLYLKTAGVWAPYTTAKADYAALLAAYPPSATYDGCIVWVTAYRCDFICTSLDGGSTYPWFPLSRRLAIAQTTTPTGSLTGNGSTTQNFTSYVIPGNLLQPGCRLRGAMVATYAGTDASRQVFMRHAGSGTILIDLTTTVNTNLSAFGENFMYVKAGAGSQTHGVGNRSSQSGFYAANNANIYTANGIAFDRTADSTWQIGIGNFPNSSSALVEMHEIEIFWPQ